MAAEDGPANLLEVLGKVELTHEGRNDKVRAIA
jgi:hypothetical protein